MKYYKYLFLFIGTSLFSQEVLTIDSEIGKAYDFGQERQEQWATCLEEMNNPEAFEKQTPKQRLAVMNRCSEIDFSEACDDIWSVVCGNDWTDEGYSYISIQPDYQFSSVSSALKPHGENVYDKNSISDLSYKTAWVEGVKGYGIGECATFEFPPLNPRINEVIIANGYIKDKKTWKNNSRVKQLKMYLNDSLYAILNLQDVYAEQSFVVPTIGFSPRKHIPAIYRTKEGVLMNERNGEIVPPIIIKFQISAVYKGDKYDDTAITEIYFDGLDVY